MGEPEGAPSFVYCAGWYPASPAFRKGLGVGLYRHGKARLFLLILFLVLFFLYPFFLGILPFDEGVIVFVGFLGGGIKWINHLIPLAELL